MVKDDDDAFMELKSLRKKPAAIPSAAPQATTYTPQGDDFSQHVTIDYDATPLEDYKKLTIDDFFMMQGKSINKRFEKYVDKSPLVPVGRWIGDNVFSFEEAHETPYQIAERVVQDAYDAADKKISPEKLHDLSLRLTKETYKVFNNPEYDFLKEGQDRVAHVDFVSTLVFSIGKGGVIWRSLANPPKPGDYRGNSALGLITELEDIGFAASFLDTGVQLARAHSRYREGAVETLGDIAKNGSMLREVRLIGASQALPMTANAFNSTDEQGNADPVGYFRENFVEKVKVLMDKDYAAAVKQVRSLSKVLPGPLKKSLEKKLDMPLDKALRKLEDVVDNESSKEARERISEAVIGTTQEQVESINNLVEIIKGDNKEFAEMASEVPGYSLARDWFRKKYNNISRLIGLALNLSEMALLSAPYSSEFLQRAEIEDMMGLVLQSILEDRPKEGYIGEHALLPETS